MRLESAPGGLVLLAVQLAEPRDVRWERAAPRVLEDHVLAQARRGRVHRLLRPSHAAHDLGIGDGPADAESRQEDLREAADGDDPRAPIESGKVRELITAVAKPHVWVVGHDDRPIRCGQGEELPAACEGGRHAARVLECRDDEEERRARAELAEHAGRGRDVDALVVDRGLHDARAVVPERRDRVRESGRLNDGDVAGPDEHAAGEVDGLQRAGRDDDLLGVDADAAAARLGRDELAQLGLAFRDAVAQRCGAGTLDGGTRDLRRSDPLHGFTRGRPDRERDGVARLTRDDRDRLVDVGAVDVARRRRARDGHGAERAHTQMGASASAR
ncbi:MAG: hypothetical protein A2082_03820 [Chloroflexi bacterium GWC2_70_10]|nr:MAG: hypothetical protein A2082_03820 [Chloroflexi bacterium GWC2_70_10]